MIVRPGLARRLALGLAVVAVALALLPRAAAAQEYPPAGLRFVEASPYVARAGGTLMVRFQMNAPPEARVVFRMGISLTVGNNARDMLDAIVSEKQSSEGLRSVERSVPYLQLFNIGKPDFTATFPIAQGGDHPEGGFALTDSGVFPFTVSLVADDGKLLDTFTTFVIALSADTVTQPMALAPIVPFAAPLALQPDGNYTMGDQDARRLSEVRELLQDNPDALTVQATPETMTALGQLGPSDEAPRPEQVAQAVGGRPVLGAPYVDLDVNAWAAAGLTGELANQLSLGAQVLQSSAAAGRPLDTGTWNVDERLTGAALDQLKSVGVDRLVLPDGVAGLDGKVFDGRRNVSVQFAEQQPFDVQNDAGGRFRAITADQRLAGRLTATDNDALNAQLALADLALLYCGPTTATKCLGIPNVARSLALEVPGDSRSLSSFAKLLKLMRTPTEGLPTPMVRSSTLRSAFDVDAASANGSVVVRHYDVANAADVPSMDAYRTELRRLSPLVSGYQSMVATTDEGRGTAVRRLLDVSGADIEPARQQEYLLSANHQVVTVADAIRLPVQEPSTLTSSDAVLDVRIDNQLEYAVTVRLEVSSDKLEFSDGTQRTTIDQVLAPNGTTTVKVDVKARASGTFSLDTRITSPDQSLRLDEGSLEVRSTAVSQLGLVLTICAGFFLLAWWIKHFRATRRSRKLVEPAEADRLRHDAEREHEPA